MWVFHREHFKTTFFTCPKLVPKRYHRVLFMRLNEIGSVCFKWMSGYKLERTEENYLYGSLCFFGEGCQPSDPHISSAKPG